MNSQEVFISKVATKPPSAPSAPPLSTKHQPAARDNRFAEATREAALAFLAVVGGRVRASFSDAVTRSDGGRARPREVSSQQVSAAQRLEDTYLGFLSSYLCRLPEPEI